MRPDTATITHHFEAAPPRDSRRGRDGDETQRDSWTAVLRGARGRCPNCGKGKLFWKFLKVVDHCPECGEAYHHQRADDAPAYFVILIVGHILVPLALAVETEFAPPVWVHMALWVPLTLGLSIGLLQPVKGAIIAAQWAFRMHGFDPKAEDDFAAMRAGPEQEPRP